MCSVSLLDLTATDEDKLIADDNHFYIYKKLQRTGYNPGIYKLSSASLTQGSQSAAFRMAGRVLHQNTSSAFMVRQSQKLDTQIFLLDGKIYMKYEELDQDVKSPDAAKSKASPSKRESRP
jgi:hypothetical protein